MIAKEDGIYMDAIDRSHITFVHLELKNELFDEYSVDGEEKINIDTEELVKVLKRVRSTEIITLETDENNLIISIENDAKRSFRIRLIDISYEKPKTPKLDLPVSVEVPVDVLRDAIRDLEMFNDKIVFEVDENKLLITGESEFGDVKIEYPHAEEVDSKVRSVYSLEKVKEMLKAYKFSDRVIVSLGNDTPLDLTFELPEGEGRLTFLLAPRLEAE